MQSPEVKPKTPKSPYVQKFRQAWLQDPLFEGWLTSVITEEGIEAKCKVCRKIVTSRYADLRNHGNSKTHKKRASSFVDKTQADVKPGTSEQQKDDAMHENPIEYIIAMTDHNNSINVTGPTDEDLQFLAKRTQRKMLSQKRKCLAEYETEETPTYKSPSYRDDFTIFGENIASELRNLQPRARIVVKHLINNLLFDAAMGKYDDDSVVQEIKNKLNTSI